MAFIPLRDKAFGTSPKISVTIQVDRLKAEGF
jgi:hypothetical protein